MDCPLQLLNGKHITPEVDELSRQCSWNNETKMSRFTIGAQFSLLHVSEIDDFWPTGSLKCLPAMAIWVLEKITTTTNDTV
jgi:hypothetical protein